MSLKEEIRANFLDADGLVSPWPCKSTDYDASNNGLMYLGEYITIIGLTSDLHPIFDGLRFADAFYKCEIKRGLYQRSSDNNRDSESVDDYYGLCSGIYFLSYAQLGKDILTYGYKNWGCYNNINPGKFTFKSFIWRQPQLLAMMQWASGKQAWLPLRLYTALILATACIGKKQTDGADSWCLTWLLVNVASRKSWLCRQASKLWWKRLRKVWPNGMTDVYKNYYKGLPGQDHPFTKYVKPFET